MSDSHRKAISLGITGGIACGKSEVGRILGEMGFAVCDADRVAHDLMEKGKPVFQQIIHHFGDDVLTEDGRISRSDLGKMVFEEPSRLQLLNMLVHPAVRQELEKWMAVQKKENRPSAVLLPLLFESGMDDLNWDVVVCVSSAEPSVFQRLEKRGLSPEEAEQRVLSQMPLAEKESRADVVINNLGTLGELELAVRETVKAIMLER
ncbi:dephospho-CoA kinase [Pontiella agarivorans]|uniref:Dephospho-CoA kinase n=1 Tax=Pontiella agarivorans TaxID=3038953 RepID=A0ABU5N0X9_9BACT|nr:dephospho-CoA kinase [Pontiella agarivorans]MDZ8120087.1 dephospho-CoA kinase [Pontiella agarivorans]